MNDAPELRPEMKSLRTTAADLANYDWVSEATDSRLGPLKFDDVLSELRAFGHIAALLATADLVFMPTQRIAATIHALTIFQNAFNRIKGFDIARASTPSQERTQIADAIRGAYVQLFDQVAAPLGISLAHSIDIPAMEQELKLQMIEAAAKAGSETETALTNIKAIEEQASTTLLAMQAAAGQVGVSKHGTIFAEEARGHKRAAWRWGSLTAALAAATAGWGAFALWKIPVAHDAALPEILQQAIGKLIIVSALYYGLVWSARNYGANRHNYIVNKHRQNSLTTFETFAKAADGDPATKNAVLLQATTSIFASQITGYTGKELPAEQPNKIVELIRSIAPTGSH